MAFGSVTAAPNAAWNSSTSRLDRPSCALASAVGGGLVAAGFLLHWTNADDDTVDMCDPLGSCASTLVPIATGQPVPYDLAVDADNVYWVTGGAKGAVFSCAKGGCGNSPIALAPGTDGGGRMGMGASCLYWVTSSGDIMKVAKP